MIEPGGKLVLVELNARWYHADRPFPDGWKFERSDTKDARTLCSRDQTWVDVFNDTVNELVIQRHAFVPE